MPYSEYQINKWMNQERQVEDTLYKIVASEEQADIYSCEYSDN